MAWRGKTYARSVKTWGSGYGTRASRIRAARSKQRALIRAGRRRLGPTRYRAGNYRTGGFLGIELKFLDVAFNNVVVNTSTDGSSMEMQPSTGCTNALSVPAQGDGESNRDGRKYTLKSIWCSGEVEYTNASGATTVTEAGDMWAALVLDTQANGATLVSEDVFVNPSTVTIAMLPHPLRNLQNSKRFKILASQFIKAPDLQAFNITATTGVIGPMTRPKVNLNWKGNIVCDSTGTTADVASASDNAVHLVMVAASNQFAGVFQGKCRTRFVG